MKKADFNEIKGLAVDQLSKKLTLFRVELTDLVLEKNMKKLTDTKAVNKKRKDIAQVLTVIRQKQLLIKLESNELDNKQEIKAKKVGRKSK